MERKTYFSVAELVGYFILIIIGLNLLIAIPVVIKLYPVIVENIESFNDSEFIYTLFVDDILLANIGWQVLSMLTLWFVFRKKNIVISQYFYLKENLNLKSLLAVFAFLILLIVFLNPASEYFDVPPNPTMEYLLNNGNIYLLIFTAVIAAPLVEEVLFRGWIFSELENRYSKIAAIHVSSILFTIIHIQYSIIEMFLVLVIAYSLALLRVQTRNLLFPILLHFLNNLGALLEFFYVQN